MPRHIKVLFITRKVALVEALPLRSLRRMPPSERDGSERLGTQSFGRGSCPGRASVPAPPHVLRCACGLRGRCVRACRGSSSQGLAKWFGVVAVSSSCPRFVAGAPQSRPSLAMHAFFDQVRIGFSACQNRSCRPLDLRNGVAPASPGVPGVAKGSTTLCVCSSSLVLQMCWHLPDMFRLSAMLRRQGA